MNSSLALSTQEQTEAGHFLSHQCKEVVKCMAAVLGGYRSMGLCIHWSVTSKLGAGWGPSAETIVKWLGLQKGPGDVCCLLCLFLWVLCLLYALATLKARNCMFWKEKVGKPPWQISALSFCVFICSCPLFFDHYGSIAFKCCGVSLVTHNFVVVYVTAAIHVSCLQRDGSSCLPVFKGKTVLSLQIAREEFYSVWAVFSQVKLGNFAKSLLYTAEKHATGRDVSITWLKLEPSVPLMKGCGLLKWFVLIMLAALERKFENPKCLVEFLWPLGNFLDTCTC